MKKFLLMLCLIFPVLSVSAYAAPNYNDWAEPGISTSLNAGIVPKDIFAGDYTTFVPRRYAAEILVRAYENITDKTLSPEEYPFTDTYDRYSAIAYQLNLMKGKGDDRFAPYDNITRQETAKIIVSLISETSRESFDMPTEYTNTFTDFAHVSEWAQPYVELAYSKGILSGYSDGTFKGNKKVTFEELFTIITRALTLNEYERPAITNLTNDQIISSKEELTVTSSIEGGVLCANAGGPYSYISHLGYFRDSDTCVINPGMLNEKSIYTVFIDNNGVYSEPIIIYTDEYSIAITPQIDEATGNMTVTWNKLPGLSTARITITERRASHLADIGAKPPVSYELVDTNSFTFFAYPNRYYTVEVLSGYTTASEEIFSYTADNPGAMEISNSYPATKADAEALQTTVTVPVWKLKGGKKVSSTASITVHRDIAERVKLVFTEIYNGSEQFPIKEVGGFSWRGNRSEHNGGTAIDINSNENYCVYSDGRTVGSYWKPYEDPYSITPYGDVVNAFEKYGFTWGGDAWSSPQDYMHFSYLGT